MWVHVLYGCMNRKQLYPFRYDIWHVLLNPMFWSWAQTICHRRSVFTNEVADLSLRPKLNLQRFSRRITNSYRLIGEAALKFDCELEHILTYRGTFLLLSSICTATAGKHGQQTDIWETKMKTQCSHVTPHYFFGYFGYSACSSDPEEIIKPYQCQAGRLWWDRIIFWSQVWK